MNVDKVLELQKISKLYTREKMFKMNKERKEVMKNRDAYLFGQEENAGSIASGDIKMIEEVLSEFISGEYFDEIDNNAINENQKVKKRKIILK